jgi:hypothetical protein
MNTIEDWTSYYLQLRLWVFPYNIEEKPWLFWKSLRDNKKYEELSKDWNWSSAQGIKLIVGKKGIRVLEVGNKKLLKKAVKLLGLPDDYFWIIHQRNKYGIVVDTPGVSNMTKGICNKGFKNILRLWEGYYVLPSTGIPVYFYKNRIPTSHPKQIDDEVFLKCINTLIYL